MSVENLLNRKNYLIGYINELRKCYGNELQITIIQNILIDVLQELRLAGVVC